MKYAHVLTIMSHGKGGHVYDSVTIAEEINNSDGNDVELIIIGRNISDVIKLSSVEYHFIPFNGFNFISVIFQLFHLIKSSDFEAINCFDNESFSLIRVVSWFTKSQLFLTKCGGPNPLGYFPTHDNLIVFSQENKNFFEEERSLDNVILIPNRIKCKEPDYKRITKLKENIREDNIFLRVGRIHQHYKSSLIQTIEFVSDLYEKGYSVQLSLIGVVDDYELLSELKLLDKFKIVDFIYEEDMTIDASTLIPFCDFYIGTGRGVMEGLSYGKVTLTNVCNFNVPIIVDKFNFKSFLGSNFSPRNKYIQKTSSFISVEDYLSYSANHADKYQEEMLPLFNKYLNVQGVSKFYLDHYNNSRVFKYRFFDSVYSLFRTVLKVSIQSTKNV